MDTAPTLTPPAPGTTGAPVVKAPPPGGPVVFFDGVCNLCNGFVQFVLTHEAKRGEGIRFASLQSEVGAWAQAQAGLSAEGLETILFYDQGRLYERSEAVLRLVGYLRAPWRFLGAFRVIPRALRDWVYRGVARGRYRMFGRREECMLPTPETRSRFL